MSQQNCTLHSSFKSKPVYELRCRHCDCLLCVRGMKAILLADQTVELYSTDLPPPSAVRLVGMDYKTSNCLCSIKDVACSICGGIVGYHVTLPCRSCLSSCNNGHFWMYHSRAIEASERLNGTGEEILVWAQLPSCSDDVLMWEGREGEGEGVKWIECCR